MKDEIIKIFNTSSFSPQTFGEMKDICAPSLNKLGLSAFEYARVYDDHTALVLYTDPNIAQYVINQEVHITAHVPSDIIDKEFWFMPDADGIYSKHVNEIKEMTHATSLANYIRRHKGFYEMFCFWGAGDHNVVTNKIMNMKESLEQYSSQFLEQANNLISLVDQHRFLLTENMFPNFQGLNPSDQATNINLGFYLVKIQQELIKLGSHISPNLSAQELKCIPYLVEGKTAADIASLLNLSPRTIEMHLNSIKNKLGCRKKSDIIGALISIAYTKVNSAF